MLVGETRDASRGRGNKEVGRFLRLRVSRSPRYSSFSLLKLITSDYVAVECTVIFVYGLTNTWMERELWSPFLQPSSTRLLPFYYLRALTELFIPFGRIWSRVRKRFHHPSSPAHLNCSDVFLRRSDGSPSRILSRSKPPRRSSCDGRWSRNPKRREAAYLEWIVQPFPSSRYRSGESTTRLDFDLLEHGSRFECRLQTGLVMSSHHQTYLFQIKIHALWGNLLAMFGFFRIA